MASVIDNDFVISIVNRIEVLGYNDVSDETRDFLDMATTVELDNVVAEATIALRKLRKIKLPDAIIAATAQVHGLEIRSRNTKDFQQIPDVTVTNPFMLTTDAEPTLE